MHLNPSEHEIMRKHTCINATFIFAKMEDVLCKNKFEQFNFKLLISMNDRKDVLE